MLFVTSRGTPIDRRIEYFHWGKALLRIGIQDRFRRLDGAVDGVDAQQPALRRDVVQAVWNPCCAG